MGDSSTDPIQMSTPRPTIETNCGFSARQKAWNKHVHSLLAIPKHEEIVIRNILAKHRRRQTRRLGARDEDPDPYDSAYIFYCLDGRRET
jgi:hypothetical protein